MNLEYYNKLVSEPPVDVAHSYIFIVSRRDLAQGSRRNVDTAVDVFGGKQ